MQTVNELKSNSKVDLPSLLENFESNKICVIYIDS